MFDLTHSPAFENLITSMPTEEKHILDAWEHLALSR